MRAIIGILIGIGLLVLVLVLVFTGGGPAPKPLYLPDYANNSSFAQMTIFGPITAPQTHNEVTVTVSGSDAVLNVTKGYEDNVVTSKIYPQTMAGYTHFLFALQRLNFTVGNNDPSLKENRGYCPFGRNYTFVFNNGTNEVERYWITSCGQGNFGGSAANIRDLFEAQIPDYNTLTTNTNLGS